MSGVTVTRDQTAGIILTGGRSTRMGQDKALLAFGGRPLWQIAAGILEPFVGTTIFAGAVPGFDPPPPYRIVVDDPPGCGPLGGIVTGLAASGSAHNLVLAVDYPFVLEAYIGSLLSHAGDAMAVCGRSERFLEPLVGYYHAGCVPVIRRMLAEGEVRTHKLFEQVPSVILTAEEMDAVDPERLSHRNLNSPDDLSRALLRIQEERP